MNADVPGRWAWRGQLVRFAVVGAVGFLVDAGSLSAYLALLPGHYFSGRTLSYLLAASSTWALNAAFTFGGWGRSPVRQWLRFLLFNLGGGLVNYSIYAALITFVPALERHPTLAVAAGSLSGLGVNFVLSRRFVFSGP